MLQEQIRALQERKRLREALEAEAAAIQPPLRSAAEEWQAYHQAKAEGIKQM